MLGILVVGGWDAWGAPYACLMHSLDLAPLDLVLGTMDRGPVCPCCGKLEGMDAKASLLCALCIR